MKLEGSRNGSWDSQIIRILEIIFLMIYDFSATEKAYVISGSIAQAGVITW